MTHCTIYLISLKAAPFEGQRTSSFLTLHNHRDIYFQDWNNIFREFLHKRNCIKPFYYAILVSKKVKNWKFYMLRFLTRWYSSGLLILHYIQTTVVIYEENSRQIDVSNYISCFIFSLTINLNMRSKTTKDLLPKYTKLLGR